MPETIKLESNKLFRSMALDLGALDEEKRTVGLTFSSEQPVIRRDRFGDPYLEVLDHQQVDESRMTGAPLLFNHSEHIGTVDAADFQNKTNGRSVVRFSRSVLGSEKFQDVKDGILFQTSVGYDLEGATPVKEGERDGMPVIRFRNWMPMEVTLCPIGADKTVGVPRSFSVRSLNTDQTMKSNTLLHATAETAGNGNGASAAVITKDDFSRQMDEGREILATAAQYQRTHPKVAEIAEKAIKDSTGIRKFMAEIMPIVAMKGDAGHDATVTERANPRRGEGSIGARFVSAAGYRDALKRGKISRHNGVALDINDAYSFRADHAISQRGSFGISNSDISSTADLGGTGGTGVDIQRFWNPLNQQPLAVADLFSQGTTSGDVVRYVRELSFTNSAARVAEAANKPEGQLDIGVVNATVEKTAVFLNVTEEMMSDQEQASSFINSRLSYMVQAKEDSFLLNGTGSSEITGILNTSGIQTVSGAINTIDQILRASAYVQGANNAGFATPDAIVMNPLDWLAIRLTKDGNGQYLFGGPGYAPYGVAGYSNVGSMWGLPVVTTTFIAQGTALVGAFRNGAQIFRRMGVTVKTTDSHASNFIANILTVLAESRFALAVYQPNRFVSVTGIPLVGA